MIFNRLCASAVVYKLVPNHSKPKATPEVFYLLTTRKNKDLRAKKCILPKGGIDPGAGPLEAARIEVFEETGVTSSANGVMLGSYSRFNSREQIVSEVQVFGLLFESEAKGSEPRSTIWSSFDEAIDLIDPHLAPFVIRMNSHLQANFAHTRSKE